MSDTGKGKIDIAQLIKILNLTQSDSDGEALNALRLANSKIKAAGLTWQDVISSNLKTTESKPKGQYRWKEAPADFDSGFFRACAERKEFTQTLSTGDREYMNKLINFYNDHHYLPEKAWTNFVDLWHTFREANRYEN